MVIILEVSLHVFTSCMDSNTILPLFFSPIITGNSEYRSALISAVCLAMALFICLIGLIIVIMLLIKYKIKFEKAVLNTIADNCEVQPRETSESVTQSSHISTKKNISYVVHSPKIVL